MCGARVTGVRRQRSAPIPTKTSEAPRPGTPVAAAPLLALQRAVGNRAVTLMIQRDKAAPAKKSSTLDAKAQAIVTAAQDSSKPESDRAVALVRAIINTYFSGDAGLVKGVVWDVNETGGLNTDSDHGKDAQGTIRVGPKFLEQATATGFARRVLQVDHELEHVRQHRAGGMSGPKNSNLREFLAHQRGALQEEVPGTGRISHATRINLIDGALTYYYKLSEDQKKLYAAKKQALLDEREKHNGKGGNPKTDPPSGP